MTLASGLSSKSTHCREVAQLRNISKEDKISIQTNETSSREPYRCLEQNGGATRIVGVAGEKPAQ